MDVICPGAGLAAARQQMEFGAPLAMLVVPSMGSSAMSNFTRARPPRAEVFALEDARRVVLDALADDDLAADVDEVEHPADGVAGGLVGEFLFALAEPLDGVERGGLRRAHEIEFDDALDIVVMLDFGRPRTAGRRGAVSWGVIPR